MSNSSANLASCLPVIACDIVAAAMDVRLLQELIECSVCLERMGPNSRVLPCQHTFCLSCLEAIARTRSELRCPECRSLVGIPVHELPPNILLIRLLESMKIAGHPADYRLSSGRAASAGGGAGGATFEKSNESVAREASTHGPTGIRKITDVSQPSARALYNYAGLQQGDLPLKRGDTVVLQKRVDDNWFYGECNGKSGFFPAAYVEVVVPLPAAVAATAASAGVEPRGRVLYDFHLNVDEEKDCLKLKKDEVVTVIRRVDSNWLEGRIGDRVGIFPASYVALNEAARSLVAPGAATRSRAAVGAVPATPAKDGGAQAAAQLPPTQSADGRQPATAAASQPVCAFSVFAQAGLVGSCSNDARDAASVTRHPVSSAVAAATMHPPLPLAAAPRSRTAPCQRSNSDVLRKPGSRAMVVRRGGGDGGGGGDSDLDAAIAAVLSPVLPRRCVASSAVFPTGPIASGGSDAPSSVNAGSSAHPVQPAVMAAVATAANQKFIPIYVAVFNYKPQRDDEIALEKGQLYKVSDMCRDGWYRGTSLASGQAGVFPGNYVQAVIRLPRSSSVEPRGLAAVDTVATGSGVRRCDGASSAASRRQLAAPPTPPLLPPPGDAKVAVPARTLAMVPAVVPSTAAAATAAAAAAAAPVLPSPRVQPRSRLRAECEYPVEGDLKSATREQRLPWACAAPVSCGGSTVAEELPCPSPPPPPPRKRRDVPAGSDATAMSSGKPEQAARHCALPPPRAKYASAVVMMDSASPPKMQPAAPVAMAAMAALTSPSQPGGTVRGTASAAKAPHESPLERYRCIASYPPQSEAELGLEVGDLVLVRDKLDDGWYTGIHQRTSKCGLFPASFVEKS